jgi:hypothetical protein
VKGLAARRCEAGHGGDEGVDRRGERIGLLRDDVGPAEPVLGGDEGRAPIVPLQRDVGGVGAVGDGEHAAGRRAAERRLAGVDEADVIEVQRRPSPGRETGHRLSEHPRLPKIQGAGAGEGDGLVEGGGETRGSAADGHDAVAGDWGDRLHHAGLNAERTIVDQRAIDEDQPRPARFDRPVIDHGRTAEHEVVRGVVDHQANRADREIAHGYARRAAERAAGQDEGRVLIAFEAAPISHVEDTAAGEGHRAQGQLARAGGLQDHAVVLDFPVEGAGARELQAPVDHQMAARLADIGRLRHEGSGPGGGQRAVPQVRARRQPHHRAIAGQDHPAGGVGHRAAAHQGRARADQDDAGVRARPGSLERIERSGGQRQGGVRRQSHAAHRLAHARGYGEGRSRRVEDRVVRRAGDDAAPPVGGVGEGAVYVVQPVDTGHGGFLRTGMGRLGSCSLNRERRVVPMAGVRSIWARTVSKIQFQRDMTTSV